MIEQNVQLVRCQDDRIWVRIGTRSGCTACDNGRGCGAGVFARLLRRKPVVIELGRQGLEAEPGQMVTLAIPEQAYMKLVFASYGWPLLAALAGAAAGYGLGALLNLGPAMMDTLTLACGVLAGSLVTYVVRGRKFLGRVLETLRVSGCDKALNPDLCTRARLDST